MKPIRLLAAILGLAAVALAPQAFPANPVKPTTNREAVLDRGKIGDGHEFDIGKGQKLTVRYVPGGEFLMGSPADEADRLKDEQQVKVTLRSHFWMAETEVTQALWESEMGSNPSSFKGADLPVELVSWEDVQDFIKKLNTKGGLAAGWKWSLPTEAQWERACRGGTATAFSFGNSLDSTQANFDGNFPYGNGKKGPFLKKTAAVRSYEKNGYGLYDLHGNVSEWCFDAWDGDSKLPGGVDPLGVSGPYRVYRGGSWAFLGWDCLSANRFRTTLVDRFNTLGFRLAAVPVEP